MSALGAIGVVAAIVVGVIPIGWLAARGDRDERFARRLAMSVAVIVLVALVVSIGRGELLRFDPGGGEIEDCGAALTC